MNLKYKFLTQSLLVLISIIIISTCATYTYIYLYNLLGKTSELDLPAETDIIILEDDQLIYQSKQFGNVQIKEMLMNISINKKYYIYKNKKYNLTIENFTIENKKYNIIKLNTITNIESYYKSIGIFAIIIFLITFIIANLLVQRRNLKNIVIPITQLKKKTEDLMLGELETVISDTGYGEVKELGKSIDQLRIELKNSIHYRQKIDENRKFLISSISHDLKTPVTAIRGYIDGVIDNVAESKEKKEEYLKKAVYKTQLINIMIEDLLLYSKLDLNQISFKNEKINILNYIKELIDDNQLNFRRENKKIQIQNNLKNTTYIYADFTKLTRVIQNILENAKKNTNKKVGIIEIILRETNLSLIIEFKDKGQGIKKEELPYIFDRFYRGDSARAVEGSSGLGLAIAKQMIEGMGGRIWAISEPGKGTSIIISLKKAK